MKVILKIRFNASRESFEKFGQNRYFLYLSNPEHEHSSQIIVKILSRKLGVPLEKINFAFKDNTGNWVFDVD